MTFGPVESALSEWMSRNALVAFHICEKPWELEAELLATVSLPLNLNQNRNHSFHATLTEIRRAAKERARQCPYSPDSVYVIAVRASVFGIPWKSARPASQPQTTVILCE